jgi:hypothetical protein
MNLWHIIEGKQVDIYINLATTLIGLALGEIVSSLKEKTNKSLGNQENISINQILNFTENNLSQNTHKPQNSNDIVLIYLIFFGLLYLFYRNEILNILLISNLFMIALWAGITIHSLRKSYFAGFRWWIYLLLVFVYNVGLFAISSKAAVPNYAPSNFEHVQDIVFKGGIYHLKDYFSLDDFYWILFHITGVIILFFMQISIILSLIYNCTMGEYARGYVNGNSNTSMPWLVAKTVKYRHFEIKFLWNLVFGFIAYSFVSGNFFAWFIDERTHSSFNEIINKILFGMDK